MTKEKPATPDDQVKPSALPEETPNPDIEPPPFMWLQKSWYKKPKPGEDSRAARGNEK